MDSLLGILKAFKREMSKSVNPLVRPVLRPRLPLMYWKSTGTPLMLSAGPDPLAPAGATHVVRKALQFGAPAAHAIATPLGLMRRLDPVYPAMLVATIAPTGAPAQPTIVEASAALQIFGRWLVSEPSAGKADPENAPEPDETGYGRPLCTAPMKENV